MNRKFTILNSGTTPDNSIRPTGLAIPAIRGQVSKYTLEAISTDPIDVALLAITHHDFLTEIESSPVLGELAKRYLGNWQLTLSYKEDINGMLRHLSESLLPDRIGRAGFVPGYIKILLFIQEKYRIYKENSPN